LEVKRPGREAHRSSPPSSELKNAWSYIFVPPICLHGGLSVKKKKARGHLYFTL